jgi:hypothetical protein
LGLVEEEEWSYSMAVLEFRPYSPGGAICERAQFMGTVSAMRPTAAIGKIPIFG